MMGGRGGDVRMRRMVGDLELILGVAMVEAGDYEGSSRVGDFMEIRIDSGSGVWCEFWW